MNDSILDAISDIVTRIISLVSVVIARILGIRVPITFWIEITNWFREPIAFETPVGIERYQSWPEERKDRLRLFYNKIYSEEALPLKDPPKNQEDFEDDDYPLTILSQNDAEDLYLAYVAHSAYMEINRVVSWSIRDYDLYVRPLFLDSRYFFKWRSQYKGYMIDSPNESGSVKDRGNSVPAPPQFVMNFINKHIGLGRTRRETIVNVIHWCRINMVHFDGHFETGNLEAQWGYRGMPPTSRVLKGTTAIPLGDSSIKHRTAGCHGTNGVLRDILRALMIPVVYKTKPDFDGHATPYFVSEELYLSHGDDPYHRLTKGNPLPYPTNELLISEDTYFQWFCYGVSNDQRLRNVGRQTLELALQHLPDYLLKKHCQDVEESRNHASSRVAELFDDIYTVAELEEQNLWDRMDAEIAARGGCENIPDIS